MSVSDVYLLIERGYDHENPLAVYESSADAVAAAEARGQWPIARVGNRRFDYDEDTAHRVYVIETLHFHSARIDYASLAALGDGGDV